MQLLFFLSFCFFKVWNNNYWKEVGSIKKEGEKKGGKGEKGLNGKHEERRENK